MGEALIDSLHDRSPSSNNNNNNNIIIKCLVFSAMVSIGMLGMRNGWMV